jgi:hypothetical protein
MRKPKNGKFVRCLTKVNYKNIMKIILYITASILIIAWVTGFTDGGIIRGLMIIAVITVIIKFFRKENFFLLQKKK